MMKFVRQNQRWLFALSLLILLGAFGIVQYYIWGNPFLTEFQADCTDTLLWAQATLESGSLFKPTFDYAYRLTFGGQWLFMPFLRIFGVGMTALRCGMCLFSLIFLAALFIFFRSLHSSPAFAALETAVMLMAVCAVKKTREIFFGHVIHYSLSVLFLLLAFILLRLCLKPGSHGKRIFRFGLFTLTLFMCSANGTVEMLFVTLPLIAGCLIEWYLNRDRDLPAVLGCLVLAAGAGFIFSKSLNTGYSDSYSVIVPASEWMENLLSFPNRWISLFYTLPLQNLDAFSGVWIKTVFKTVAAAAALVGLILSYSRYKTAVHREELILIFTVWAMAAAFLFFFTFGRVGNVEWRLIPLIFGAQTVTLVLFCHAFDADGAERTVSGGLVLLCGLMLLFHAASNGLSVLRIPYDRKIWYAEDGMLETLKANDLDYGYITNYWLSNSLTVLSDEAVKVRYVSLGEKKNLYLVLFNSDLEWYGDQPGRDRWFLALRESEYDPEMPLAKEASEIYTCYQEDTRNGSSDRYVILVLTRNIMQSEYEALLPRYR